MEHNKSYGSKLLVWQYYSIIIFLFLSGIVTMLFSKDKQGHIWLWLGELGAFIAAAITSHFVYDKLIRRDEQSFFLSQMEEILSDKKLPFDNNSGIIDCNTNLDFYKYANGIISAKKEIWILQTWIVNFPTIQNALKNAILRNIEVKILISSPTSVHATARGEGLSYQNDFAKNQILQNLDILEQIANDTLNPKNLIVKTYTGSATLAIYAFDNIINLGFFWRKENSTASPHLTLRYDNDKEYYFSNYAKKHFDYIWSSESEIINFKDLNWRNKF